MLIDITSQIVDDLFKSLSEDAIKGIVKKINKRLTLAELQQEETKEEKESVTDLPPTVIDEPSPPSPSEEVPEEDEIDESVFDEIVVKNDGFIQIVDDIPKKEPRPKRGDPGIVDGKRPPERIGTFFLDSGAHSLYNKAHKTQTKTNKYAYYETDEFWQYVDEYAAYVKANIDYIDYYVNVDVIHNPKLTRKTQKYLELEHDLNPVPVVHMGTGVEELKWYLKQGYDFIGLGGVALEGTRTSYIQWADKMFDCVCNNSKRLPCVRLHGFAMTAYASLTRYPWWSVDSASWAKAGGFGIIYVPHKRKGKFVFDVEPYSISVSSDAPAAKKQNRSVTTLPQKAKEIIVEWLNEINIPLGEIDKEGNEVQWGVISHHSARKIANLRYFERLTKSLPEWPWPFKATLSTSFGLV